MKRIIASIMLLLNGFGYSQNIDTPDQVKIRKARKIAKQFLRSEQIPGMSISVSAHGTLIWSEGFGYASKKPNITAKPDETVFRIASISKTVTAVALEKLVDDGLIDLDKSVYHYVPDFPKKKYDFTVRQLAGNIAGIRHYKDNNEYTLNKKMSITEGLSLFKNDSLLFKPGSQYHYSTLGFVLLSEVIQKAANKPFNTIVNDIIFKPLNMKHSSMEISDAIIPFKTEFYRLSLLKKVVPSTPVANEYKLGGGGFLSTSEDIVKFGNELIFPKILSERAITEITTSQRLDNDYKTGYGLGMSISKSINETPKFYHTGGGVGASTILIVYPKEEIVITVLTNLTGVAMKDFGDELEAIFLDAMPTD
jgi:serine beta-lactamase-like protein LACTB, mitochondrial